MASDLQHARVWGQPIAVLSARTNPFDNDVSTRDTIRVMRKLVYQYANDPLVMSATAHALSGGVRSQRQAASAIFYWIRATVQFIEDEQLMYEQLGVRPEHLDKELLIPPPVLLSMPQPMGDCDDFSLLMASMLLCAGMDPYFVTVAADPEDSKKFTHIYVCVCLTDEGRLLGPHLIFPSMCLDAGNRLEMVPPGWEAATITRKAIWAV